MNNAPFRVGQRVVCIRTVTGSKHSVVKGSEYIIQGIRKGTCKCAAWLVDVGIRTVQYGDRRECIVCKTIALVKNSNIIFVGAQCFAPIPPRSIEIPESLKEQAEEMKDLAETIAPIKKNWYETVNNNQRRE